MTKIYIVKVKLRSNCLKIFEKSKFFVAIFTQPSKILINLRRTTWLKRNMVYICITSLDGWRKKT